MNLRIAFLAAGLLSQLMAASVAADQPEPPSFLIKGKPVYFYDARVIEDRSPRRTSPDFVPPSDKKLLVSVRTEDFPHFPEVVGGLRSLGVQLPDGQIIMGKGEGSGWSGNDLEAWTLASFPIVPWRAKQLTLRFEYDGQRYELPFANPGYREDISEWGVQGLPVTWKQGELEATLEGFHFNQVERRAFSTFDRKVNGKWSFRWKGSPANNAFGASFWVEDAAGNRAADGGLLEVQAWRLHCTVSRTWRYPFGDDEVRWFGWTKADRIKTIPTGECDLLAVDAFGREAGLVFAGLFGAGTYEMEDGRLISKASPGPESPVKHFKSEFEDATGKLRLHVHKPTFVKQLRRNQKPGWMEILLDPEGMPVFLGGQGTEAGKSHVWWHDFWNVRDKSFQYGFAYFGAPMRFELLVRPPAPTEK